MKESLWLRIVTWGGGLPILLAAIAGIVFLNKALDSVFPERVKRAEAARLSHPDSEDPEPDYGRVAPGQFGD